MIVRQHLGESVSHRWKTLSDPLKGKYQLQVFPEAGHFIQEDQAQKTAMTVANFYKRNDRSALILPPKVGVMLPRKT